MEKKFHFLHNQILKTINEAKSKVALSKILYVVNEANDKEEKNRKVIT